MVELQKFILQHSPEEGLSHRTHCPACGGRNTFTLSKLQGKLLWNCYKADCKIRGVKQTARTKTDIMQKLHDRRCKGDSFAPLEYFTEVSNNDRALRYLKNNNCLSAYENRFTKIMYDPKQDRVVFFIKDGVHIVDAIGRSLNFKVKPKWYRYGKSHTLFTCGDSDTAIVVEDAASACAVSQTFTGVALLGTNLKDMDLSLLKKFHKVYICLDPDATRKALDIQKYLCYVVPTKVIRIKDDLKYFGSQEIKKLVLNNNL
tara:strand:- start:243 stop:1019 length:777 start_codon:yes stop_codon:yes gene_type:complete